MTTGDLFRLDAACQVLDKAWPGRTYIVGSTLNNVIVGLPRDVDVRTILDDAEFNRLFPTAEVWQAVCVGIGAWLREQTGLPIDYQAQRMTEANGRHTGPRNPIGSVHRLYAGAGDGTPWDARGEVIPRG